MKTNEQPGFYAIIPAFVRYDKELKPNAKLLYGEITALCNQNGYCYASNNYFAELYGVDKMTVSKWIKQLIDKGYLINQLIYKPGTKEIKQRRLYIGAAKPQIVEDETQTEDCTPIDKKVYTPPTKKSIPIDKKVYTPIDKKVYDNNTDKNNTINNTNDNLFILKKNFENLDYLKKLSSDYNLSFERVKILANEFILDYENSQEYKTKKIQEIKAHFIRLLKKQNLNGENVARKTIPFNVYSKVEANRLRAENPLLEFKSILVKNKPVLISLDDWYKHHISMKLIEVKQ